MINSRDLNQLRHIRRRTEITATRIGQPGCFVRRTAEDDLKSLDAVIAAVESHIASAGNMVATASPGTIGEAGLRMNPNPVEGGEL